MVGKGNPQWPHAFFNRIGGPITIEQGDFVTATCRYYNKNDQWVGVGGGRMDEMCNMYLMYKVPYKNKPLSALTCWGYYANGPDPDEIPDGVNDMCPYPGYAGPVSDAAIAGGIPKPNIPETLHHSMGGNVKEHVEHHDMQIPVVTTPAPIDEEIKNYDLDKIIEDQLTARFKSVQSTNWKPQIALGEVAGVDTDKEGHVWIFHRGSYTWDYNAFDYSNRINYRSPIKENCVVRLNGKNGSVIATWGSNLFYMPHGLTVTDDHIWLTDVGTHQIYKFHKNGTKIDEIGKRLVPGEGKYQFCKPTDVMVDESSGEFFVSDGYCNSRVVHFSSDFEYLDEFGTEGDGELEFNLVHDLAAGPGGQIFISDRENGRIQVYDRITKKVSRYYENKIIGPNIYASAYSPQSATLFLGTFLFEYTG